MKRLIPLSLVFAVACFALLGSAFGADTSPAGDAAKLRCLVVTGGHDFEKAPFQTLFKNLDGVAAQHVEHPKAQALFAREAARGYDVLVLYDMWQKIDGEAQANFVNLLKNGKGLVVMHHAIANYNEWDQYAEIIGAKYYLKPMKVGGVEKARSEWKHDVKFTVQIADTAHPITRGLRDFEIHDETYNLFDVYPGVKPLLTTTEPTSGKTIAWAKEYGQARVVYLQLGHDHFAYENPNFRQLLRQAIRWAAKED